MTYASVLAHEWLASSLVRTVIKYERQNEAHRRYQVGQMGAEHSPCVLCSPKLKTKKKALKITDKRVFESGLFTSEKACAHKYGRILSFS